MDLNKILGGIGNGISGAIQGVGNFVGQEAQQIVPQVQNFVNQAGQALLKIPQETSGLMGFNNPVNQVNPMPMLGAMQDFASQAEQSILKVPQQIGQTQIGNIVLQDALGPFQLPFKTPTINDQVNQGIAWARSVPRSGFEGAQTLTGDTNTYNPKTFDPVNRAIFGDQPLQNFNDPNRPSGQFVKGLGLNKFNQQMATPLLAVAGAIASDTGFLGPEEKATESLLADAKGAQNEFHTILESTASDARGEAISNIKTPQSIAQKIAEHLPTEPKYGLTNVNDVLRGSVVVPAEEQVPAAVDSLKTQLQNQGWTIQKEQNFFKAPSDQGYTGYHIDVKASNGVNSEIQIHTPESFANAHLTHPVYDQYGGNPPPVVKAQVGDLQTAINKAPVEKVDAVTKANQQTGDVLSPMATDFRVPPTPETQGLLNARDQLQAKIQPINSQLPKALAGAKPRYGASQLQFASDTDKASYIVGDGTTQSAGHDQYVNWLKQQDPTLTDTEIQQRAAQVKNTIKGLTPDENGVIKVPSHDAQPAATTGLAQIRANLDNQLFEENLMPSTPESQATRDDLRTKIAQLDTQIKQTQGDAVLQAKQTSAAAKTQIDNIDKEQLPASRTRGLIQARQDSFKTGEPMPANLQTEAEKANQLAKDQAALQAKKDAGLPTLRTEDQVMTDSQGNPKIDTGKNRNGLANAINYPAVPMSLDMERSPDPSARVGGYGILDYNRSTSELTNRWNTMHENALKGMSQEEIQNGIQVQKGIAKPISPKAANYAKTLNTIFSEADKKAQAAGILTKDENGAQVPYQSIGKNYFPRSYTQEQYQAAIAQAKTPEEAANLRQQSRLYTNRSGNLEYHRTTGLEGFVPREDSNVVSEYIDSAASRIVSTSIFGPNSENAQALINNMLNRGNTAGADTFKRALEINGIAKGPSDLTDPTEALIAKATKSLSSVTSNNMLSYATLAHHLTVFPSMISQYGLKNTVKAVPSMLKGFFGKYSDTALEDMSRLHPGTFQNASSKYLNTLYNAILLNPGLNGYSAGISNAARSMIDDMEGSLASSATKERILQAKLPYDEILQRGSFTPQEKNAFVQAGAQNAGLLYYPSDIPKMATNPIGKAILSLSSPITARTQRQIPLLYHQITNAGNLGPTLKWGLLSLLAGTTASILGEMAQNHPAQTPIQSLQKGALLGLGLNYGPVNTTSLANLIEYPGQNGSPIPEYLPSVGAGMIGGPIASMGVSAGQAGFDLANPSATASNKQSDARELTRLIPFGAGPTIANTAFPAKSWVGNRPSDLAQILATGNKPQQQGSLTVQHSPLDLLRANPQVSAQSAQLNTMYADQGAAISKLTPPEQTDFNTYKALEAKGVAGDTTAYNQANAMLVKNPNLFDARAAQEIASAKANGTPVNPLYDSQNRAQALTYLKYQDMAPTEQAKYLQSNPNVLQMDRLQNAYKSTPQYAQYIQNIVKQTGTGTYKPYVSNPLYENDPTTGQPKFTNTDVAAYYVHAGMPTGTAKTVFLGAHPNILQAQIATQVYDQQKYQSAWDNRPDKTQTPADFVASLQANSTNPPNISGIDANGKVVPAYNLLAEPRYQLAAQNPQLIQGLEQYGLNPTDAPNASAIYLAYKSALAQVGTSRNYGVADGIAAQYPWLPTMAQVESQYYAQNPINSSSTTVLGGNGVNLAPQGSASSGYSSTSSMDAYFKRQMVYQALADIKNEFNAKAAPTNLTPIKLGTKPTVNPLANYYKLRAQKTPQTQAPAKLLAAPKLSVPKFNYKVPTMAKIPNIKQPLTPGRMLSKLY